MTKNSNKSPPRPKVPVPLTSIQNEFKTQLKFLRSSCEQYDAGDRDEFRRIALAVRVLLHDRGYSRSVAGQLDLKSVPFRTFSLPLDPSNLISETPLIIIRTGQDGTTYLPCLDMFPIEARTLNFEEWWNEDVFQSSSGISMARSGFILHTADQAGGAHVDPELDEDFHKIANENEGGWTVMSGPIDNPSHSKPMQDLEKAYVRQIGFEVLSTLEPEWARIQGNRICDCGSGKKYRYCHGKGS